MRRRLLLGHIIGYLIVILAVTGCAGVQKKPVVLGPGEKTLVIKASSFKFEPNYIKASQGDTLTINVENTSSMEHNLTIKSPKGSTLANVNLPGNKTTSLKVSLAEPGTYRFYCDKPLHSSLGMKGEIEASAP